MPQIINGKQYDPDTSERLYAKGQADASDRHHGRLLVYRSQKGTVWAILLYWPRAFGPQSVENAAGDQDVRRLCESLNRVDAIEAVFGTIEEG